MLDREISDHNTPFLRRRGRLRVFAAADATIMVRGAAEWRQICQIGYSADGSIRVQWPYLRVSRGIVAAVTFPEVKGPATINLHETGRFTSQLVKYSHHASGAAHFNKTKYTTNEVRRQSFPLNGPIGRLFELSAYFPDAYKPLTRLKPGRLYLGFGLGGTLPQAVLIKGEWRRRSSMVDNAHVRRASVGPMTQWMSRHTGVVETVAFFAPPLASPIKEHMLCVTCQAIALPTGVTEPGAILLGAFDRHDRPDGMPPQEVALGGGLVAMYPAASNDDVIRRVGTIDVDLSPIDVVDPAG